MKRALLTRAGAEGERARYSVTLGALREAFPGLVSRRESLVAEIREQIFERDEAVSNKLRALENKVIVLSKRVLKPAAERSLTVTHGQLTRQG